MKNSPIKLSVCLAGLATVVAATALAGQPPSAKTEKSCTGMVTAVDPQEHAVMVKNWWLVPARRFELGENCTYVIPGKNSGTFNDLRAGEKITVSFQKVNGVLIADRIEQQPMRLEGAVTQIDPAKHTLTLHRTGMDKSFQIADDCAVALRGGKTGALADVQTGNYVTVTYETPDAGATARLIEQTSREFTGRLTAIDLHERTVKAKAVFETKTFHLGDNCAIVLDGKPNGQLADLKPDEKLDFSFDEINGVNVVNRIAPAKTGKNSGYVSESLPGDNPNPMPVY